MAEVDEHVIRLKGPGGAAATIARLGATVVSFIRERKKPTYINQLLLTVSYTQPRTAKNACSSLANHLSLARKPFVEVSVIEDSTRLCSLAGSKQARKQS